MGLKKPIFDATLEKVVGVYHIISQNRQIVFFYINKAVQTSYELGFYINAPEVVL